MQFTLRQIEEANLSGRERARLRCQLAQELEEAGNYEAARSALGELWQHTGARPALDGLDDVMIAEVLLRAGSLTGWLGSAHQIEKAQERAKDLISESAALFEKLDETEKAAEAYISLATCYWREGALDEARVTLEEVIKRLGQSSGGEQKARALLSAAVVETSAARLNEALRLLLEAGPFFERTGNHAALGRFHGQMALVLRKLGMLEQRMDYIDRALVESEAASYHFEQAGHHRYRARTENNVGYMLQMLGRFQEAHEHLDRAARIFTNLKDHGSSAQVNDTRARVFLAQGRNREAERLARVAVRILEKGDESSRLAEALTTHAVALARLGQPEEAHSALGRALEVAERAGDQESAGIAAITIIEELGERLTAGELCVLYERADELLEKSKNRETLERLRNCARRLLTLTREQASEFETQRFIYADERTAELLRKAHLVAGTQGTVLITGEPGTGKEVLARLIHEWSGRSGPFIAVNCGALAETRLESELFGHRRGSFADAIEDQAGAVRLAEGGTLFLDGITELSHGNQGKLLRLIEHGEIHSIGAGEPERVDVRVVVAASCELKKRVALGSFREDLLYRLNTFHLTVPPLRERKDDIPRLATHFIREFTRLYRRRVELAPEALAFIRELELPGNVRQLRSLIERLVLVADDATLITESTVEMLVAMHPRVSVGPLYGAWEGFSLRDEILNFEARLIRLALEASDGSVTHAARLLGISHQRLGSMLEGRHKNLLLARKPAQPRKHTIITKLQRT